MSHSSDSKSDRKHVVPATVIEVAIGPPDPHKRWGILCKSFDNLPALFIGELGKIDGTISYIMVNVGNPRRGCLLERRVELDGEARIPKELANYHSMMGETTSLSFVERGGVVTDEGIGDSCWAYDNLGGMSHLVSLAETAALVIPDFVAFKFAKQVLAAMKIMHDSQLMHRSLDLNNVFVNQSDDLIEPDFRLGHIWRAELDPALDMAKQKSEGGINALRAMMHQVSNALEPGSRASVVDSVIRVLLDCRDFVQVIEKVGELESDARSADPWMIERQLLSFASLADILKAHTPTRPRLWATQAEAHNVAQTLSGVWSVVSVDPLTLAIDGDEGTPASMTQ